MKLSEIEINQQFPYVVPAINTQQQLISINNYNTTAHKNKNIIDHNLMCLNCWCYEATNIPQRRQNLEIQHKKNELLDSPYFQTIKNLSQITAVFTIYLMNHKAWEITDPCSANQHIGVGRHNCCVNNKQRKGRTNVK